MNSNDIEIQAAEWLAKLDRESLSLDDLAALDRWKTSDPRHAAAYARLSAVWQALDRVQALRPGTAEPMMSDYFAASPQSAPHAGRPMLDESLSPDFPAHSLPHVRDDSSAKHSASTVIGESARDQSRQFSKVRMKFLGVAASVVLIIIGIGIAYRSGGTQTYRTGIGGFQRIVLNEQSAIELNTDSEVRVALTAQRRKIELVRGEASFEVAHDVSRPFIVSAGNTAVRAVGTKFDVHRLDDSVEITVDEGRVAIGAPALLEMTVEAFPVNLPQLSAGQTATANGSGVSLKSLPKNDLARKLAWQNQMLVFDGDSLADVVSQFNRYNQRQLVILDPKLAALHIGGYFRPTNLDAFISVLQSDFGIRVHSDGNRLELATPTSN